MIQERRPNRPLFLPILFALMAFAPLSNALNKPAVQALRAVDLLGLIAAGFCFGTSIATLLFLVIPPWLKARHPAA